MPTVAKKPAHKTSTAKTKTNPVKSTTLPSLKRGKTTYGPLAGTLKLGPKFDPSAPTLPTERRLTPPPAKSAREVMADYPAPSPNFNAAAVASLIAARNGR